MKKIISHIASALMALTLLFSLGACSKSGDMESILKTVPADSYFVMTFNGEEILNQLDYKQDGDNVTYCKELKELLDNTGLEKQDLRKITDGIDLSNKALVVFGYDKAVYMATTVKSGDDFRKWFESVSETKLEDEGSGFLSGNHGRLMLKDNQVWICSEKIDIDDLKEMLDLDSDDSFAGKYSAVASEMCNSQTYSYGFLNISECLSFVRKFGGAEEAAQIQLALGMVFKDASYVTLSSTISSDKSEGQLTVLNNDLQPAEFLIPMGKINTAAMNKVNNDAFFVAALDISPEFVKMISGLVDKYASRLSASDKMVIDMLLTLSGTSSFSINGMNEILASIGFKDEQSAAAAGQMLGQGIPAKLSTAGNFLVLRTSDTAKAGGTAPKEFEGNFLGVYIDFANPAFKQFSAIDMSDLGNMVMTLGPNGKGVQLKSVWKVKEPMKASLRFLQSALPALLMGQNPFVSAAAIENSGDYPVVDEIAIEEDEFWEPEPDSDDGHDIEW